MKGFSEPYQRGSGGWYLEGPDGEIGPYESERRARQARTRRVNVAASNDYARRVAEAPDLEGDPGKLSWWIKIIGHKAKAVAAGGSPDDRNDLRALAQAGTTIKQLCDLTALEAERDDLRALVEEILGAREHGTRTQGRVSVSQTTARSGKPLH